MYVCTTPIKLMLEYNFVTAHFSFVQLIYPDNYKLIITCNLWTDTWNYSNSTGGGFRGCCSLPRPTYDCLGSIIPQASIRHMYTKRSVKGWKFATTRIISG